MEIKKTIINLIKKHTKLKEIKLETPPNPKLGDYSFPCFELAKKYKSSPNDVAKDLEKNLKTGKEIEKIQAIGPYLNFFINKNELASKTIRQILKEKDKYGSSNLGKKQKLMIEFSQPNTHKAFHVGHVRGTSLGESLARIFEFLNYKVLRANYQGDTGAHVSKWLWYYLNYYKKQLSIKDREKEIAKIYVEAVKKLVENPDLQKEVDEINYNLENKKDKKLLSIWKKTRKYSLDDFEKIYTQLNTKFDHYFFEREMEGPAKEIIKKMLKEKIAKESDGAVIINLEKYDLGKWVLLRKDGTTLYSAKDIALAKIKFIKYKIQKNIYIVGAAQSLHLKQLFKTLELLKFRQAKDCFHLAFSEVRLPSGKMSSRTGENILYTDMLSESLNIAQKETKKRNPQIQKKDIEKIALKITIAAIKFSMLSQDPNKLIVFDNKKEIKFEGNTGPYIQYTYARLSSILRKSSIKKIRTDNLTTDIEKDIITKLSSFPEVIEKSAAEYKPALITNYLIELSQTVNEFYHKYPVLKATKDVKSARLSLISAIRIVIKNGLNLLGIDSLESM